MRKVLSLLVACVFFLTVMPAAFAADTSMKRSRSAKQNRNYAKGKKHRKAPKARWGNGSKRRTRGNA